MPPKKTEMQKLLKQIQKEKRPPKEVVTKKPKETKKFIKTNQEFNKMLQEDRAIREFFTKLQDIPGVQVTDAINVFSSDSNAYWDRKRFFETLKSKLPEKYYKEFARDYISQEDMNKYDFLEAFSNLPSVVADIKEREKEEEDEYEEEERLKQIQKEIGIDVSVGEYDSDEEEELMQAIRKKKYGTTKMIDIRPGGEVIEVLRKTWTIDKQIKTPKDSKCVSDYSAIPWLESKVNGIYLLPVTGSNISPYIISNMSIENDGEIWYRANKKFALLMCNDNAESRNQEGDVLTAYAVDGTVLRMKIAYDTNLGLVIQDENLFETEKRYLADQRTSRNEKINRILDENITTKIEQMGMQKLSEALHKIAPDIADYGIYPSNGNNKYDTAYIINAIQEISNNTKTIREFLTKLAQTIIYLKISGEASKIFQKRVIHEYYLPEILVNLTPADKLPEFFDDPRTSITEQEQILKQIKYEIDYFVSNIGETLYGIRFPSDRIPSQINPNYLGAIPKVHKWKEICVNKEDIIDIPDDQLIYYKEDGVVYCLTIPQIMEQTLFEETPINPYTGNPLSEAFLTRFSELYTIGMDTYGYYGPDKQPEIEPEAPSVPKPSTPESPILAPGLLNMIVDNIKQCEKEVEEENMNEEGKCPAMSEGKEIIESTQEEPYTSSPSKSEISMSDSSDFSPSVVSGEVCKHCNTKVDPKLALKTKINTKDGFETIYFCCFKCFENEDNWPKNSSKKTKPKKSKNIGKKGGRNSTKERQVKKI
jgi:hypothetical protein